MRQDEVQGLQPSSSSEWLRGDWFLWAAENVWKQWGEMKGVHSQGYSDAPWAPSWEAVLELSWEGKPPILPMLFNVCVTQALLEWQHSDSAVILWVLELKAHWVLGPCGSHTHRSSEHEACFTGIAQAVSTQILHFKEKPSQSFPIIFSALQGNICQEISLY